MKLSSRFVLSRVMPAVALASAMALGTSSALAGSYFAEEFNTGFITATLPPSGWVVNNLSDPPGLSWFQGNTAVFGAGSGLTSNSYVASNFNAVDTIGVISNWLITPPITAPAGARVSFLTRTNIGSIFPDRLELRYAATNTTNVGATSSDVGDFGSLLVSVNPTLTVGGYPETWTSFQANLPTAMAGGRLAFRYFVDDGGSAGEQSSFIGVDFLNVTDATDPLPTPVPLTPPAALTTTVGGSLTATIGEGEVLWYKFIHAGGAVDFNTSLTTDFLDTEIGLYASDGTLIDSDDDSGPGVLSQLAGTLAAGTYYLAVSQFEAEFDDRFDVTSDSTDSGEIILSGLSLAPNVVAGDFNFDGVGDFGDLDGALALLDEADPFAAYIAANGAAFLAQYGRTLTVADLIAMGDFNSDTAFDFGDLDGYLAFLDAGGSGTPSGPASFGVVPEPAALGLLAPVGVLMSRRRR